MLLRTLFNKSKVSTVDTKTPVVGERNIFQFAHDITQLPSLLLDVVEHHKVNNPTWNVYLVDDLFMLDFIGTHYGKDVKSLYEHNKIPASRCDMARIMLIQHYGGIYVDLSFKFNQPFDKVVANFDLALVQRDDFEKYKDDPSKAHFTNSFIYAPAKSVFMTACYNQIVKNLTTKKFNFDVINATGPGVINSNLSHSKNNNLGIVSFKNGKNTLFDYVRVSGFSNSWLAEQSKGIFR